MPTPERSEGVSRVGLCRSVEAADTPVVESKPRARGAERTPSGTTSSEAAAGKHEAAEAAGTHEAAERADAGARRFRSIAEQSAVAIFEVDAGGRLLYASPSTERVLGLAPSALLGTSTYDLIHPDDRTTARDDFMASMTGASRTSCYRLRAASGWRWVEATGHFFHTADGEPRGLAVIKDVTDRIEAQAALERQLEIERSFAELSRRLLASEPGDLDAELQEALAAAARLTATDHALLLFFPEALGGTLPAGGRPAGVNRRYEWCREGIPQFDSEFAFPWSARRLLMGETVDVPHLDALPPEAGAERRDFERRGVQASLGIPVRSGERLIGFLGFEWMREPEPWTSQEVLLLRVLGELFATAFRRMTADRALRASQAQLLQSQKMEAVGRFAGGIAHDFNNLLMVIGGNSALLLEDLPSDHPGYADASEIASATDRAAALARQLLVFTRPKLASQRRVPPGDVVRDLEGMLRSLMGEDVNLTITVEPDAGAVEGDVGQLEQLVVNLATNARDAMRDGGTLDVTVKRQEVPEALAARLGLAAGGDHVVLEVTDNGCGMDEATAQHVFDPFFTTKALDRGTGLGLSIAYSVVQRSSGVITVETELGEGSAFRCFFPRFEPEGVEPEPTAKAGPAARVDGTEWVLLVEDEASVRRILRGHLDWSGYQVLEASNGADALALAAEHTGPLHALVSDVVMPEMNGAELADTLLALRPELRVLLVSGHPEDRRKPGREAPRVKGFLQKPFTREHFLTKLREVLDA